MGTIPAGENREPSQVISRTTKAWDFEQAMRADGEPLHEYTVFEPGPNALDEPLWIATVYSGERQARMIATAPDMYLALLAIATMDVYTAPDDPEPAHEVMRRIAKGALIKAEATE